MNTLISKLTLNKVFKNTQVKMNMQDFYAEQM